MEASQPKHFSDGDEWMLAEAFPGIDFFFSQIFLHAFVNDLENSVGRNYSKVLAVFDGSKGYHIAFYYGKHDCLEFTRHVLNKIVAVPSFGDEINAKIRRYSDELVQHAASIANQNLASKTNAELWEILKEHVERHTKLYEWGWLSNATDMFYPEYTDYLKNYLRSKTNSEEQINQLLVALTAPEEKSEEAKQQEEFLRLAARLWEDNYHRELIAKASESEIIARLKPWAKQALEEFHAKYGVIGALYVGEPFTLEHYALELKHLFAKGVSPREELAALDSALEKRALEKQRLLHELEVDEKHTRLFAVYAGFMLTKFYRRYAQIRALYAMRSVLKEIARRFGITLKQARFMLTPEYKQLLTQGGFNLMQLREREKFCVLYSEKDFDKIFVGKEARKLAPSAEEKHDAEVKELRGQCARVGSARGRVKIILSTADLPKMRQGDVLVAIATNPDVVPAMKKASAIVTEQGGVTCHAAIVSRELGIPCVIGTKVATKVLKDGDFVEVDATKGIVRKVA